MGTFKWFCHRSGSSLKVLEVSIGEALDYVETMWTGVVKGLVWMWLEMLESYSNTLRLREETLATQSNKARMCFSLRVEVTDVRVNM